MRVMRSYILTHRFASPLPFAISKTNTLKHVVSCFVGPLPSVPNFVRPPILMAAIWVEQMKNNATAYKSSVADRLNVKTTNSLTMKCM